jgi:two-component system chemotaxis sensor kinase CheA
MGVIDPIQVFLQEAQELLEQLEQTLLDLERTPDDGELIDTAFRALHTVKGSGSMFGFEALAAFTHHVENAFDQVRKGATTPTRQLIAVALAAKDQMRLLIEQPDNVDIATSDAILGDLERCMKAPVVANHAPAEIAWRIRFRLSSDAMVTGTNPLSLLDELRSLGPATVTALSQDVPPLEEMDPTACYLRWEVTLRTEHSRETIEQVFLFVLDEMELEIEPIEPAEGADVKPGVGTAAATPPVMSISERRAEPEEQPGNEPATAPAEQKYLRIDARGSKNADTIRVPAERLDELMDRVGELVIAQSRLKQIAAATSDVAVKSVAEEIERLSLELRDTTMGVRMLPIGQLFGRFRRLIHDLARELGKQIELVTIGEETELDKTVIERLNDPLIHSHTQRRRPWAGGPCRPHCLGKVAAGPGNAVRAPRRCRGAGLRRR